MSRQFRERQFRERQFRERQFRERQIQGAPIQRAPDRLAPVARAHRASWLDRAARDLVFKNLARLGEGSLRLEEAGEAFTFGPSESAGSLASTVRVLDPGFHGAVAFGGTIGAGESYMRGEWQCDSLPDLVRLFLVNRGALDRLEGWAARCQGSLRNLVHAWRRNSHRGSRDNIAAHYDLGNDFFSLFLDESMMYSCALFEQPGYSLAEASEAKNDRICQRLELAAGDHFLEIGGGWGGFALHAAGRYGCRVTTTTISREQHALASRRVREAGLADRVTVLSRDYRDLTGQYDKLVSIEMIEAVGHAYLDRYFAQCGSLLKPEGLMLLQAILIPDQQYEAYRRGVDFIRRYIFPGGCLPSLGAIHGAIRRRTDLQLTSLDDLTPHYARTLELWRARFLENIAEVRGLGYPESFVRMWEFYLAYCEGAFRENATSCATALRQTAPAAAPRKALVSRGHELRQRHRTGRDRRSRRHGLPSLAGPHLVAISQPKVAQRVIAAPREPGAAAGVMNQPGSRVARIASSPGAGQLADERVADALEAVERPDIGGFDHLLGPEREPRAIEQHGARPLHARFAREWAARRRRHVGANRARGPIVLNYPEPTIAQGHLGDFSHVAQAKHLTVEKKSRTAKSAQVRHKKSGIGGFAGLERVGRAPQVHLAAFEAVNVERNRGIFLKRVTEDISAFGKAGIPANENFEHTSLSRDTAERASGATDRLSARDTACNERSSPAARQIPSSARSQG